MKLKFLSHYLETSGNGQGAVAEQRYRQATNLYYRVMKRLLDIVSIIILREPVSDKSRITRMRSMGTNMSTKLKV